MKKRIFTLSCFVLMTIFIAGCNSNNITKNTDKLELNNSIENTIENDTNTEINHENEANTQNTTLEKIALEEVKKITAKYGYSLKSENSTDTMVGDSDVFKLIKEASIKSGYSESDLNFMTENRKILEYELDEKSKKDKAIKLSIVLDNEKVIGAYLDYTGYNPGITSIDFVDDFKDQL